MSHRRIRLVLEALTPICHGDTVTGIDSATNTRLFMRQPVLVNGRLVRLPHVSENALRTVLLRIPLADHLVATLGVAGDLPRGVLNLLYAGGGMGGGKRAPGDEAVLGHAIGRLYPSLSLLGGAVDAFILPRGKLRLTAFVVAAEYADKIEALFPDAALSPAAMAVSVDELLGEEMRTRGTGDEADGNQMLYGYDVLAAGTAIAVEMILDHWTSDEAAAAIARAVAEWPGFVGGQGRQGRGRCRVVWSDGMPAPDAYDAHLAAAAEAMRVGLVDGTLGTGKTVVAA